jgi:hypothetical protein
VDEDVNDVVVVNVETIVESSEVNVVVIVAVAMPVLDPVKVEIAELVETLLSDAWDVVQRLEMDDSDISDHQYSSVRLEYGPSSRVTVLYPILQGFQTQINTRLGRWLRGCREFPRICEF